MADLLERMRGPVLDALSGESGVHVVGGAVRDALLGRTPHELDIVVEGPAEPVARRAAARLGGDVVLHDRFGTATVRAPGATFDVVTARTENYERPGALPDVHPGATIAEDLARRDFTVNAMAVGLDGSWTAVPGAEADLRAGVLRVLHDRSFADDPTRLLRMARYAARLGFEPEPHTDALAAAATTDTVTGGRLGSELRLLLREPQPAALLALNRHGLGARLLPGYDADAELIRRAIALTPGDARPELAALATTVLGQDVAPALDRLEFERHDRDLVAQASNVKGTVPFMKVSDEGDSPLHVWRAFRALPPEAVAVAGALGPAQAARSWLEDVRHRRPAIDGHDLLAAGLSGPAVGRGLEAAHAAMLEGADRDGQLAAALAS
jgi:tRNA nucleotidyltransferase (CCA-adding enzyme)